MTNMKIIVVGKHALKWLTKSRERDGESGEWQHKNKVGKGKYLKIFLHYARKRMPKGTQPMLSKAMIFLGQLHFSTNSEPIESTWVFHSYGLRNARTIHTMGVVWQPLVSVMWFESLLINICGLSINCT